ncbi:MAG: sulfurtransferase [Flavobacteriaceae bacterium]|nr:sulfurtransferase [Flavobacteriaceae bacterium]|tara:strand:- start:356616 stop:357458 length:843 start_codon:yes stop_codon:yes gene_type:complete
MSLLLNSPIVSVDWLHDHLHEPNVVVLYSSLKKVGGKGSADDFHEFIPNSLEIDIKSQFSDLTADFPNTLLSPEFFQERAQSLGINADSCIVVYDGYGIYSAPRVWWMFQIMGFRNIAVLDGGLPEWISKGYATTTKLETSKQQGNFKVDFNPALMVSYQEVLKALNQKDICIADARSIGRFFGIDPEPRQGVRGGHMPNAISLPYGELLQDGKFKPKDELKSIFFSIFNRDKKAIFSCGTGVTACVLGLGATLAGYNQFAIYDGSWTEWGSLDELPIEK